MSIQVLDLDPRTATKGSPFGTTFPLLLPTLKPLIPAFAEVLGMLNLSSYIQEGNPSTARAKGSIQALDDRIKDGANRQKFFFFFPSKLTRIQKQVYWLQEKEQQHPAFKLNLSVHIWTSPRSIEHLLSWRQGPLAARWRVSGLF